MRAGVEVATAIHPLPLALDPQWTGPACRTLHSTLAVGRALLQEAVEVRDQVTTSPEIRLLWVCIPALPL